MTMKQILEQYESIENAIYCYIDEDDGARHNALTYVKFANQLIKEQIENWKLCKGNTYYVKEIDTSNQITMDDPDEYVYTEVIISDITVDFQNTSSKSVELLVQYQPLHTKYPSTTTTSFKNAFKQLYVKVANNYYTLAELFNIKTED